MNGRLPPISFACRGFVRKDGTVFGWTLLQGDHSSYHRVHGTTDRDFATRWRKWSARDTRIDIEERPADPEWEPAILAWLDEHADDIIPFAEAEKP